MDVYIIDANVIFSATLNINSGMGEFILRSSENNISLYAPRYLKIEIQRHFNKIVSRSRLKSEEVKLALDRLYIKIQFIDDNLIPFEEFVKAMRIVRTIDPDDVTFVALANYLDASLWTGDTKLYSGLKKLGFKNVVNFSDLKKIYKL